MLQRGVHHPERPHRRNVRRSPDRRVQLRARRRHALRRELAAIDPTGNLTVHGFRSTFRSWAAELTDVPAEIAEMALAHTVGSEVSRAYQRSDWFARRRQLAEQWAAYCAGEEQKVVTLAAVRG